MKQIATGLLAIITIALFLFVASASAAASEEEAKEIVMDYYKGTGGRTLCGDSMYVSTIHSQYGDIIVQGKGIYVGIKPEQLTYEDQINGTEWKGYGSLLENVTRIYYMNNKEWTPWRDSKHDEYDLALEKKSDRWLIIPINSFKEEFDRVKPITCRQIEMLPK
jgi:hypothetical protein